MLVNPDDGYIYGQFSNIKVSFKCPICGRVNGEKYISSVSKYGLSCKFCSDGISYPNRLMASLLSELKIDYDSECYFDWCKFPDYNDLSKYTYGKYDFVIETQKIIIEMDGGLGHGNPTHSKSKYWTRT